MHQLNVGNGHRPIDGLAHVIDRQRSDRHGGERFHLHAGAAFQLDRCGDIDRATADVGHQIDRNGGQRQRIALARAILRDPEILLLDEATSQIDVESEQLIHEVLEEFSRDRTTLMITHRMSMISLADRVVVMDQGRILDVGTHSDLLRRCELYGRLCHVSYRESA